MNQGRMYLILHWLQDSQESQAQGQSLSNISGAVCAGAAKHSGALQGPSCCSAQDKSSSVEETITLAWSNGSGTRLPTGVLSNWSPHTCVPIPQPQKPPCLGDFFNGNHIRKCCYSTPAALEPGKKPQQMHLHAYCPAAASAEHCPKGFQKFIYCSATQITSNLSDTFSKPNTELPLLTFQHWRLNQKIY